MKQIKLLIAMALFANQFCVTAQTGIAVPGMTYCDNAATTFMANYGIPGMTLAISKNGKLIYSRGFGKANTALTETTQPHQLFRIASLSKPITSIAIMKLVEEGRLSLSDHPFGPTGLLHNNTYLSQSTITDTRIYDITIKQLLEHSAGWNRDVNCYPSPTTPYPYFTPGCDPISAPLYVTASLGASNPVTKDNLIRFLLQKGLNTAPGTTYNYSNIGYLILGRVIEEISGMSYEDYVKNTILSPLGICDMHLGKNLLADKLEREAEYSGQYNTYSCYGTGAVVPWQYGGWSLEAMDSHGGWVASARDLVKLLVAIDGFSTKPDILSAASIQTMVTPSTPNAGYANGWQVNSSNNWWHTGSLDGTSTIMARTASGYTWAVLLNKRVEDVQSNAFWSAFDNLPWTCVGNITATPTFDLMLSPENNAADIAFSGAGNGAVNVNWTSGTGTGRILVASETDRIDTYPLDGTDYTANAAYGNGNNLGNNNFIVYNGTGNSATITGLNPASTYYFRLFEYNKTTATGNNAIYKLCNSDQLSVAPNTLATIDLASDALNFKIFPNPTNGLVRIESGVKYEKVKVKLTAVTGQLLSEKILDSENSNFTIAGPSGNYLLTIEADGKSKTVIVSKK